MPNSKPLPIEDDAALTVGKLGVFEFEGRIDGAWAISGTGQSGRVGLARVNLGTVGAS
jgi:hypothetical protein